MCEIPPADVMYQHVRTSEGVAFVSPQCEQWGKGGGLSVISGGGCSVSINRLPCGHLQRAARYINKIQTNYS